MAEHLYDTQVVGGSIPPSPTNVSEWYAYNMTVNELITELDLLPADAEVHLRTDDGAIFAVTGARNTTTLARNDGTDEHFVVLDGVASTLKERVVKALRGY